MSLQNDLVVLFDAAVVGDEGGGDLLAVLDQVFRMAELETVKLKEKTGTDL